MECPECGGNSWVWNEKPVCVGKNKIEFWLYSLIAALAEVQYGDVDEGELVPFRFDGGLGLIVPIR